MSFHSARNWDFLGLGSYHLVRHGVVSRGMMIPHWLIAGLLAVPAVARSGRRARRRRAGLCPTCRYDLKHDFTRRCPECGWNPPPDPRAASPAVQ